MTKPWLMGIDLGGSGARCLLVNRDSGALFAGASACPASVAPGTFGTGFDVDPERVWAAVGAACQSALAAAGTTGAGVHAVAISAMRYSTVLLDDDGRPLLAVNNKDARAAGECFALAERAGDRLLGASGGWPVPMHAAARLLWLRGNDPDAFARIERLSDLGAWLAWQLCGVHAMDPSLASSTGLFSLTGNAWCTDLIDELELPLGIFPDLAVAGTALGELSPAAAEHLGLDPGTLVGMGGADTQCGLLGSGAINPGDEGVVAGTTAPLQRVLAQPVVDPAGGLVASHHVVPGRWVLEGHAGPMGESLDLLAHMFYADSPDPVLRLLAEAAGGEPGAAGILSTIGADVLDMRAPTVPIGQIALSHMGLEGAAQPRRELARAVIEGCACALRANLDRLAALTAQNATGSLALCGGLSRSEVFAGILSDISGRQVTLPRTHQTTALGAAICAGVAAGDYADFAAACAALAGARLSRNPDTSLADSSRQLYDCWRRYRQQAAAATSPVAAEHLLPRILRDTVPPAAAGGERPALSALVSASFDAASLARLRGVMAVEYASFREAHRLLTGPSLVAALAGKQVLVTEVDVVDADALAQLPDLRVIAACRGDAVNVDVEACSAYGIPVLYAPGRNAVAVADLTVGFMLALARKLPAASRFLQQEDCTAGNMGKMGQAFSQLQGNELWRKTIGLVGLGAVGRAVARRLAGFEARILVADPFVTAEQAALAGCTLADLDTLLQESDFISLHAAVTPRTTGMIGAAQFAAMKPGAFFINTARAALVDEESLVAALGEDGPLAGAALDTFAVEPPGHDHPLVQNPAVITTPHCAGNTVEVAAHQGDSISRALLQLVNGEQPGCVLNPQVLADFSWQGPRRQPGASELAALRDKSGPAVTDLQRDAKARERKQAAAPATVAAPAALVDAMRAILEKFCAGMSADPDLASFSAGQAVTLHFNVHDLGLDFHISLQHGTVASALGPPATAAEVELEMRGEILDGMFTGTIDTMECAMNGEISFMGDAAKAMTLQQMSADMERLYKAARESVGDPGDLAAVPRPGAAVASKVDIGPGDIREDLVEIMQELYESQVITATGGNISVRIPDTEDELWITPSRLFKGDLKPEVMVRINLGGESLDTGARSPSSEWCMHTRILEVKPEAKAVIHAHAPNATILANTGLPFLPISTEAAFFGNIPRIPFTMPGTAELADAVAAAMEDEWAALLVNHGLIVAGRTLRRAADMVEIIERSAEVILGCYAVGREPPVLPAADAAHFRRLGDIVA